MRTFPANNRRLVCAFHFLCYGLLISLWINIVPIEPRITTCYGYRCQPKFQDAARKTGRIPTIFMVISVR